MAGAAGCFRIRQTSGRAGRVTDIPGAAGSLVLRRVDRRGHKRGLVRANKDGTKSGSDAPFRLVLGPLGIGLVLARFRTHGIKALTDLLIIQ